MMLTRKSLLLSVIVVAIVALFAATEVRAQEPVPTLCATTENPPQYTINMNPAAVFIDSNGLVHYPYVLTAANKAALQKITRLVIAINSPGVTPDKIIPQTGQTLSASCTPDPATKTDLGNCDTFQLLITPNIGTALTVPYEIVTTLLTRGTVTHNVNTTASQGAAISTCIGQSPPGTFVFRGIMGPGAEYDPNEPIATTTNFTSPNGCLIHVTRDKTGKVISVTTDSPCQKVSDGETITSVEITTNGETRTVTHITEGTVIQSVGSGCTTYTFNQKQYTICN